MDWSEKVRNVECTWGEYSNQDMVIMPQSLGIPYSKTIYPVGWIYTAEVKNMCASTNKKSIFAVVLPGECKYSQEARAAISAKELFTEISENNCEYCQALAKGEADVFSDKD